MIYILPLLPAFLGLHFLKWAQLQVLAENAYEVIQDAIEALEELSDADGEDEGESDDDDDDDDNNSDAEAESINGTAEKAEAAAAAAASSSVPITAAAPNLQPSPESDMQEQSYGFKNGQPFELPGHSRQAIFCPADVSDSVIPLASESVRKPTVTGLSGCTCFGLLNEPEWGLLWVMGMLACVSLGLMTAMAQSEDCGCGIMTCTG